MTWEVRRGDCVEAMQAMESASVDAVVCDPPYGLEFMGKEWDRLGYDWESSIGKTGYTDAERMPRPNFGSTRNPCCRTCRKHQRGRDRCECATPDFDQTPATANRRMQEWHQVWATEALRVLKPGGHLLAFGGSRTYHRLVCAVEDAGFEIRDTISWLYGSGFPKSLDVSKAIDRAAGAEREVVGRLQGPGSGGGLLEQRASSFTPGEYDATAPATPEAERWQGWGTALKPAHEPVVVARKPLSGTVASTVLEHGTGALNVDGCRVGTGGDKGEWPITGRPDERGSMAGPLAASLTDQTVGRWPPNCLFSHSEGCAVSSGQLPRLDEWEYGENLCDSCAVDAAETPKLDRPATVGSTAASSAEPTTNAKAGTPPPAISKTGIGCSVGTLAEALSTARTARSSSSIDASGRTHTVPSPMAASSTTSTATSSTIGWRTCRSCGAVNTTLSTTGASQRNAEGCVPDCPVRLLDEQTGELTSPKPYEFSGRQSGGYTAGDIGQGIGHDREFGDSGGASRFFPTFEDTRFRYVAKAGRAERNAGLDGFEEKRAEGAVGMQAVTARDWGDPDAKVYERTTTTRNSHPTVKPIELMRWLVRLVTPPGGTVLDPFTGSGSTGCAAVLEGFDFVGIEREPEYADIAEARIGWWFKHRGDGLAAAVLAAGEARDAVEATGQLELDW